MSSARLKIITTEDGSHSLLREDLNETYHSFHGAMGESIHVFIQHGIKYVLEKFPAKQKITVFEVGFGTGLNAFLAARFARENNVHVDFYTTEPIPVPEEIYTRLNFGSTKDEKELLLQIHRCEWEHQVQLTEHFRLKKLKITLESLASDPLSGKMDVIFFDAFAPSKQAEVWSPENLTKCYNLLAKEGILTTYCAQGQFKRNLGAAGFEVQTLKGAMGKKEMVRGRKTGI